MATYDEVLNQVQDLTPTEQLRLLEQLQAIAFQAVEVEGEDEVVSATEIAASHAAWQDYLAGRDRGISSKELNLGKWKGFLPKRIDALELERQLRRKWDER